MNKRLIISAVVAYYLLACTNKTNNNHEEGVLSGYIVRVLNKEQARKFKLIETNNSCVKLHNTDLFWNVPSSYSLNLIRTPKEKTLAGLMAFNETTQRNFGRVVISVTDYFFNRETFFQLTQDTSSHELTRIRFPELTASDLIFRSKDSTFFQIAPFVCDDYTTKKIVNSEANRVNLSGLNGLSYDHIQTDSLELLILKNFKSLELLKQNVFTDLTPYQICQ